MTTGFPDSCSIDDRKSYPFFDPWDLPWPVPEEEFESTEEVILIFDEGYLIEERH